MSFQKKQWLYNNWCVFLFPKSWFSNANGLVSYFLLFAMHWNILVEINLQIALFFFLFTVLSTIHKNWNTPSITLSTLPGSCSSTVTQTHRHKHRQSSGQMWLALNKAHMWLVCTCVCLDVCVYSNVWCVCVFLLIHLCKLLSFQVKIFNRRRQTKPYET